MAPRISISELPELLKNDTCVKIGGVDVDGILRGKLMSKKKFLSIAEGGFGFCSLIFAWDMHDMPYTTELSVGTKAKGYGDIIAVPDLSTFRRIPWENNVPFFLVNFFAPNTMLPISACPRGLLQRQIEKLKVADLGAMAGVEYEFYQFKTPDQTKSVANFLRQNPPQNLPPLTTGMFGYSLTRPLENKDYYYEILHTCARFDCDIEAWHTESGPGVFEAALEHCDVAELADRANLFKWTVKAVATAHGITPCFMAKPQQGLPGNSGHMHVSLVSEKGQNLLVRSSEDSQATWPDIEGLSDLGRHFLAGLLDGLPDVMPLLAPTINSYKRLVENYWAPVTVSWGLEHRAASIRLVAPPTCKPTATRFEIRVAGADANAYFVLAAILGLGWRGVEKKMAIPFPPGVQPPGIQYEERRLARTLRDATNRFKRPDSVAREVFGDEFVNHFAGTREHEIRLFDEAVTDWETKRYIETV